jgi:hypothetical protein
LLDIKLEKVIEPEEVAGLNDRFEFCNFFNTPLWLDILVSSFAGFSASWITAREGGKLVGVMPVIYKKIFPFHCIRSLPFGTYGTPVAEEPATRSLLAGKFAELASSPGCLDAVCSIFDPDWESWFPLEIPHMISECRITELKGDFETYMSERVSSTKRKTSRRCRRAGVEARPLAEPGEVEDFHRIYMEMSKGWGGIHPLPLSLFRELFLKGGDNVIMMGAFKDGRLLGGHVDFYSGNVGQAWQAGLSKEGNRCGAAPYLVLEAIREAYRRNIRYFNLGSSSGDPGLIEFKESLGGTEFEYPIIKTGKRLWRWIRRR